ncbi:MAG: elongation factor 1-beta [Candidatus Aenigmatarchaeota archaeon]
MGDVAISLKVTPDGTDVDLENLTEKIAGEFPVEDSDTEEIGFGLTALKLLIVRDEDEGGTDDIENYISDMKGVTSVTVENVSLL